MKKISTLLFISCFLALSSIANPVLSVNPNGGNWFGIDLGTTNYGVNTAASNYTLYGSNLTPSDGSIYVGCTAFVEFSLDGVNFSQTAIYLPYSGGTLAPVVIYVRGTTNAPPGNYLNQMQQGGGGANMAFVDVTINVLASSPVIIGTPTDIGVPGTDPGVVSSLITSYELYAGGLIPASGNVTLTPGDYIEISLDGINFTASPLNVPYTGGYISAQEIYIRNLGNCQQTLFNTQITQTGGGATPSVLNMEGSVMWPAEIVASSSMSGFITNQGTPSASQEDIFFVRSVIGNDIITITPSNNIELSTDNINFSSTVIQMPTVLDADSVPHTPIYVRISGSAPAGAFSGTITYHDTYPNPSPNTAPDKIVNITGTVVAAAPAATINAGSAISGLSAIAGTASASGSYTLSASDLTPASGNITITPGSFLEVSLDNINFTSSLQVPYSSGVLTPTSVYVRMDGNSPVGSFSGTVANSGGGASSVSVNVSGEITADGGRISLGPNPANTITNILLPGNTALTYINISDFNGRIIRTISTRSSSVPLNVTGLTKGVYTIHIIRNNEHVETRRLIVN